MFVRDENLINKNKQKPISIRGVFAFIVLVVCSKDVKVVYTRVYNISYSFEGDV